MGAWSRIGQMLQKNGVPRLAMGIYYVDYFAQNGNAACLKRAAAIADIAAGGFDFVITPIGDSGDDITMAAAQAAGLSVIPERNAPFADSDPVYGPFDIIAAYDDVDANNGATNPVATVTAQLATYKATLQGAPLTYISGGYPNYLPGYETAYTNVDIIAMQGYPVPYEGVGRQVNVQAYTYLKSMIYQTGAFIPNVQCCHLVSAATRGPTPTEIKYMSALAMNQYAAGIFYYSYYDTYTDLSVDRVTWKAVVDSVKDIRNSEAYYLSRLNGVL